MTITPTRLMGGTPTPTNAAHAGVRVEVQALRALAVMGVLVYHLWPHRLQGGYVGVDVFFVVSGFLITDHLLREVDRRGRISLASFWARRARRLLPASLLVLAVTALAVRLWAPEPRWAQFGGEVLASAFYVENWSLAAQAVDYMALSNVASPVQHYWSLSVEEQFYVLWPLLIMAGALIAARARWARTSTIAVIIGALTACSLVYSVVLTATAPTVAYFSTFTRAWEFGAGAMLALVLRRRSALSSAPLAAAVSWAGFAAIVVSMFFFTSSTPFPSFTALLPVLGTAAVIAAGAPRLAAAPTRLLSLRPVQFVGDVSYGTYLWHWPIIVLVPYATGAALSAPVALLILASSIVLGWLSKRFVEDPVREWPIFAQGRPRRTFLASAVAMVLVAAAAIPLAQHRISPPALSNVGSQPSCFGARAMMSEECGDPESIPRIASLSSFAVDVSPANVTACERSKNDGVYVRCEFGDTTGDGPHVALIGDSHAARFTEALTTIVSEERGSLSSFLVSGCPVASVQLTGSAWGYNETDADLCRDLTATIFDAVAADPTIDTVVMMNRTRLYVSENPEFRPLSEQDVLERIEFLRAAGKQVVIVEDPPEMNATPAPQGGSAPDCLQRERDPSACSLPRAAAQFDDPMASAAELADAHLVDLTDMFCTPARCLTQIGGVVVYSDDNHLTRTYARSLVPFLTTELAPSLD